MSLPVYSRTDLSRVPELVVAPSLAAATTRVVAREFRTADSWSDDDPTVQALCRLGRLIAEPDCDRRQIRGFHSRRRADWRKSAGVTILADFGRQPFEAAIAGIDAKARRDPAAAELTGQIRKVE